MYAACRLCPVRKSVSIHFDLPPPPHNTESLASSLLAFNSVFLVTFEWRAHLFCSPFLCTAIFYPHAFYCSFLPSLRSFPTCLLFLYSSIHPLSSHMPSIPPSIYSFTTYLLFLHLSALFPHMPSIPLCPFLFPKCLLYLSLSSPFSHMPSAHPVLLFSPGAETGARPPCLLS